MALRTDCDSGPRAIHRVLGETSLFPSAGSAGSAGDSYPAQHMPPPQAARRFHVKHTDHCMVADNRRPISTPFDRVHYPTRRLANDRTAAGRDATGTWLRTTAHLTPSPRAPEQRSMRVLRHCVRRAWNGTRHSAHTDMSDRTHASLRTTLGSGAEHRIGRSL